MMTTNPNTIRLDDEQRASLARIADKNGKSWREVFREAIATYEQRIVMDGDDVEYTPTAELCSIHSWEEFFADPTRPSADFMQERLDLPAQERELF